MIDSRSLDLYYQLSNLKESSLYYPQMLCEFVYKGNGIKINTNSKLDQPKHLYYSCKAKHPVYADWYKCLGYMMFGYGNLSNNDRRRKGLPSVRKKR